MILTNLVICLKRSKLCAAEKIFFEECKNINEYINILNFYRNLYYQDEPNTEHGIMARAINETFMKLKELNVLDKLTKED